MFKKQVFLLIGMGYLIDSGHGIVYVGVLTLAVIAIGIGGYCDHSRNKVYEEVRIQANTNKDEITTLNEWEKILRDNNIQMDDIDFNPRNLKTSQLNRILDKNSKTSSK